jgi:hypothetical protein
MVEIRTFDCVTVKTLIDLAGLDKVTDIRHSMRMLRHKRISYTTALDTNATERNLAHITFRRRRGPSGKEILAVTTVRMARRRAVVEVPCMIRICDWIRDRLRTSPAIRVAW